MKYQFNYIITIHNKQDLIREVMTGVLNSCSNSSVIYPVLDGCTDDTEKIIDCIIEEYKSNKIIKLYAPDVHEIKSLNIALRSIPQNDYVLNISLQDDVILSDTNLEANLISLYDQFGFENIGTVTFRHGATIGLDHKNKQVVEKDITESVYGVGMTNQPIPSHMVVEKMVGVRSPECISSNVINKVGYFDEDLAPYTWDNHDLSLRCLKSNLRNFTFAVPFSSEIKWGGMRNNPHSEFEKVMKRNREILYLKHNEFITNFSKTTRYNMLRISKPFFLKNIVSPRENQQRELLEKYYSRRALILVTPYRKFLIDFIKKNLSSVVYFLIYMKIKLNKKTI